jgi:hypothetical protein
VVEENLSSEESPKEKKLEIIKEKNLTILIPVPTSKPSLEFLLYNFILSLGEGSACFSFCIHTLSISS